MSDELVNDYVRGLLDRRDDRIRELEEGNERLKNALYTATAIIRNDAGVLSTGIRSLRRGVETHEQVRRRWADELDEEGGIVDWEPPEEE